MLDAEPSTRPAGGAVVAFPDIHGRLKARATCGRASALPFSRAAVAPDLTGGPIPLPGYGDAAGLPSLLAVPEPETRFTDHFLSGWPIHLANLYVDSAARVREPLDSRTFLREEVDALAESRAVVPQVGFEVEFLLLRRSEVPLLDPPPRSVRTDYGALSEAAPQALMKDLLALPQTCGVAVATFYREYEPLQLEITLPPLAPLDACDNLVVTKAAIQQAAHARGFYACFLPQPFNGCYGNGLHINVGIGGSADKVAPPHEVRGVLGGLANAIATSLRELIIVFCPTVNSFKRLRNPQFGRGFTWIGEGRRDALVRIADEQRCELRFPDPLSNPYLAVGVIAKLMADAAVGVAAGTPEDVVDVDPRSVLPDTLSAALQRFRERAESGPPILSEQLDAAFIRLKDAEIENFESVVSHREWEVYGGVEQPVYPAVPSS